MTEHDQAQTPSRLPMLPLRDVVVFPHMVVPLFVGRDKSISALEAAMENGKKIFLVAQREAETDDPTGQDVYDIGTVATVLQMLRLPDGTVKVLVEGTARAYLDALTENDEYLLGDVREIEEAGVDEREEEVLVRTLME